MTSNTVSPLLKGGNNLAVSKIVLYAMIGAIVFVLLVIIILIICLCKRRKRRKEVKDPAMQMKILDDEEEDKTSMLCGKSKKKKKKSDNAPVPASPTTGRPLYEPSSTIEGVYERISSADIESKYDVTFLHKSTDKVDVENTYVAIGRSNSFNPTKERPKIRKSRDELERNIKPIESIKLIETGIIPSETDDMKSRLQEITQPEPHVRVKQKRTSTKKCKTLGSPATNVKTHELVRITPPAIKKDLNKTNRLVNTSCDQKLLNTAGFGKPASISGASVVSSNDGSVSEATSCLGTDSGYEEINSENSPTVKRLQENTFHNTFKSETSNSNNSSPVCSRNNYIEVEVVPNSKLLEQRSNSIIARRNSKDSNCLLHESTTSSNYTEVTVEPHDL